MADDLERRPRHLADGVGETRVLADLGARVRRRRTRRVIAVGGGVTGALLVASVAIGAIEVSTNGLSDPGIRPAQTPTTPAACRTEVLSKGPTQSVPGDPAAQDFSVVLVRGSPTSCTIGGFWVRADDGSERARATLSQVTLDPGAALTLRVRWDTSTPYGTQPQEVRVDAMAVASVALPTCGDLSIDASVRAAQ